MPRSVSDSNRRLTSISPPKGFFAIDCTGGRKSDSALGNNADPRWGASSSLKTTLIIPSEPSPPLESQMGRRSYPRWTSTVDEPILWRRSHEVRAYDRCGHRHGSCGLRICGGRRRPAFSSKRRNFFDRFRGMRALVKLRKPKSGLLSGDCCFLIQESRWTEM